jgi:hypothetical protein
MLKLCVSHRTRVKTKEHRMTKKRGPQNKKKKLRLYWVDESFEVTLKASPATATPMLKPSPILIRPESSVALVDSPPPQADV